MENHTKYCAIYSQVLMKVEKCNCGFVEYRESMEASTLYQGWTNSATWSCSYLVKQERAVYDVLSAICKAGKQVTGKDVKDQFDRLKLKKDSWTKGKVNWNEIADSYNSEDWA